MSHTAKRRPVKPAAKPATAAKARSRKTTAKAAKTPTSAPATPTTAAPKAPTVSVRLVVRRGALRRFDALTRKTAELPVDVTWDRRTTQRRSSADMHDAERRNADRRQAPPATWDLADFIVVEPSAIRPPRAATKKARSSR